MNKSEAHAKAVESDNDIGRKWCPLCNSLCRKNCYNRVPARVIEWNDKSGWFTYVAYCSYFDSFQEE